MRIAVCSHDTDERYRIARIADEILPPRGLIPKTSLFPLPQDLLEMTAGQERAFDLVLLSGHREEELLQQLCRLTPVILIGEQSLGPVAFDVGAAYFIEAPADREKLEKAIAHCVERSISGGYASRAANRYWRRC